VPGGTVVPLAVGVCRVIKLELRFCRGLGVGCAGGCAGCGQRGLGCVCGQVAVWSVGIPSLRTLGLCPCFALLFTPCFHCGRVCVDACMNGVGVIRAEAGAWAWPPAVLHGPRGPACGPKQSWVDHRMANVRTLRPHAAVGCAVVWCNVWSVAFCCAAPAVAFGVVWTVCRESVSIVKKYSSHHPKCFIYPPRLLPPPPLRPRMHVPAMGCRYWPREDQWDALAPGCTEGAGGASRRREGGLLWVKGGVGLDGTGGSSAALDCIGARTLPGRLVLAPTPFHVACTCATRGV
jgi:hypothetical protein